VILGRQSTSLGALIAVAVCVVIILSPPANAAELWSSVPDPFPCDQASNSCVSHTGFSPTTSYWGQYTNTKGNCTNYAAYRLQRNGAAQLQGSGNAISWRDRVVSQYGAAAVNGTPSIGSIAWWGTKAGAAGHVAYVEKVSGTTIYISESVWDYGSRRRDLTAGTAAYPDAFLHIKDKPAASNGKDDVLQAAGSGVGWRVKWGATGSWVTLSLSETTTGLLVGDFNGG
jgi:surface antigen